MKTTSDRIVVGVDGSACSVQALRWALREALTSGAEVEVVLVWSDPWRIVGPPTLFGAGRQGLRRLKEMLDDRVRQAVAAEKASSVVVTQHVVAGNPAETLVERSATARLLVVGTTGHSELRRWMLGSVSQRCGHLSKIPLVLVPTPDAHLEAPVDAPSFGQDRASP
ncbi:MAG: universal stress protein [Acidimicrobiales bacterium]